MDFVTDQAQLNDLPATFKRPDQTYLQLIDAFTALLYRFTQGSDSTAVQILNFSNAQFGWLDVWGLLLGIPRMANEADSNYLGRIAFEVTAGAGPALQIVKWISIVYHVEAIVTENFPAIGYTITFPATVTEAQAQQIVAGLSYVRPAGVPITGVFIASIGTFLETINFFNAAAVVGAYLAGGLRAVTLAMGASTNNAVPILPTLFLTDPTLNPGLQQTA